MKIATYFTKMHIAVVCCALLALLLFFRQCYITYNDTTTYGGIDLRPRIVGTRLVRAKLDPYFTKWEVGMDERLCDPFDTFKRPVNRNTATPFVLWIQSPLALLPYKTIRTAWWVLQQLFLASIVVFFIRRYKKSVLSVCAIALAAALFSNSTIWLYHSERGQIYILYAWWVVLLFALWNSTGKYNILVTACWLAAGVLLRPLLLAFALPAFIKTPKKKWWVLTAASIAFGLVLITISNTWHHWQSYFAAMGMYNDIELKGISFNKEYATFFPIVIEGMNNVALYKHHPDINFLNSFNTYLRDLGHRPSFLFYVITCVTVYLLLFALLYKRTKLRLSYEQLLTLGTLLYVCAEVCLPFRNHYNLVMWLPALLMICGYVFYFRNYKPDVPSS
jgi:hypothetical protein